MSEKKRTYIAIDLKSFYASVECAERHLDPLTTNLVVADESRTEKTICLAVSPSLKAYGIPGRARLFEVIQKVREVNNRRLSDAIRKNCIQRNESGKYAFASSSFDSEALAADSSLELGYIVAPPRMQTYMDYSTRIYNIYLKYIAPDDIHVYSIDECFMDVTHYLEIYHLTAHELCMTMIREVLYETGITATGGIGTNLYLAKVAMDIVAKHVPPDKDGVRIAELDEMSYRKQLWTHDKLTDFWQIGHGYERKLQSVGLFTMGDIAVCSLGGPRDYYNEELLYKLFGVKAEILIDHAFGYEPTTIAQIKAYKPQENSISSGQVLHCAYPYDKALLIVKEMTDQLVLDLVAKGVATNQIVLWIGYDREGCDTYKGAVVKDWYGRPVPKPVHKTINLGKYTSSTKIILEAVLQGYESIVDKSLMVRRVNLTATHILREEAIPRDFVPEQLDLFTDYAKLEAEQKAEEDRLRHEKSIQKAMLEIKTKFGKNAILKGMNFEEGGRARERNREIGGHKAE